MLDQLTADATITAARPALESTGHARWVRVSHWLLTASILVLAVSGVVILMAHPRLYWGETGNDLTPALIELPISRNHRHGGWVDREPVGGSPSAITANRTYSIFNENGWGRSLHFLAAWFVVVPGAFYLVAGLVSGHFRRNLWPRLRDCQPRIVWAELVNHIRLKVPAATGGPDYGLLQQCAYCGVIFVAVPLAVLTGLAMSPTVAAAYPFLQGGLGGFQSARTLHFFSFVAIVLFAIAHVIMVIASGFRRQMRGMTLGR